MEESARARVIRVNEFNKAMSDSADTAARLGGDVVGAGLNAGAAGVQAGLKAGAAGVRGIWGAVVAAIPVAKAGLLASLGQVDRLLNKAGGDDPFMLWLLRFLLVATMLIVGTIVLFSVYKTSGAL